MGLTSVLLLKVPSPEDIQFIVPPEAVALKKAFVEPAVRQKSVVLPSMVPTHCAAAAKEEHDDTIKSKNLNNELFKREFVLTSLLLCAIKSIQIVSIDDKHFDIRLPVTNSFCRQNYILV